MRALTLSMMLGLLVACSGAADDDSAVADDDVADDDAADDDGGGADDDANGPAELAPLSDGDCPPMPTSGTYTIESSGEERVFTLMLPDELAADAPLLFFFHGLLSPDYSTDPSGDTAQALGLQGMADEMGAIVVAPEARILNLIGEVYLWELMENDDLDLVFYDDLRTCMATELGADPWRVVSSGFSSGSLFTTVLLRERGDTLAAILELSGGADVEVALMDPIARYDTPAHDVPALLVSGGDSDEWPEGLGVIDFQAATDNLQQDLLGDDQFVVRCRHDAGHTVTSNAIPVMKSWLFGHTYGGGSPFENQGIDEFGSWCEVP